MGTTYTYPNGQVFTSNALKIPDFNTLFHRLFSAMFGIDSTSPLFNDFVRIGWQTEGAPAWTITDNFISFNVTEEDSDYNKIRDFVRSVSNDVYGYGDRGYGDFGYGDSSGPSQLLDTYRYTRTWRIRLTTYGPNSTDNARQVRSSLLFPWSHDILSSSNLYVVPNLNAPVRVPELYQGRWWEVVSFQFLVNEQVTETLTLQAVKSVEVINNASNSGQVSDIIIST